MKFSMKDFFSKCRKQHIWSHLLEKSLIETLIFCVVVPFRLIARNIRHAFIASAILTVFSNVFDSLHKHWSFPLTLFRVGFFGDAYGLGGGTKKNLSHISYNDETWHSYTLAKGDPKNIWITWHTPWVLMISAFFQRKSANFAISRNTDIDCILIHNFYLF